MTKRFTQADIAEMKRLFYERETLTFIAELFNTSAPYVCFLINKDPYGKNRPEGDGPNITPRQLTLAEQQQILDLSNTLNPSIIALRLRVSTQTVNNVLRQHAVQ